MNRLARPLHTYATPRLSPATARRRGRAGRRGRGYPVCSTTATSSGRPPPSPRPPAARSRPPLLDCWGRVPPQPAEVARPSLPSSFSKILQEGLQADISDVPVCGLIFPGVRSVQKFLPPDGYDGGRAGFPCTSDPLRRPLSHVINGQPDIFLCAYQPSVSPFFCPNRH